MFFSHNIFFSFFFKKKFLADTCPFFGATGTPVLDFWWRLLWVSKDRVGSALFAIFAEANVMYIPQDPPLLLHLPTSWRPAQSVTSPHACAEVGLGSDSNVQPHKQKTNALPLCQRPGFYHNIFLKTSTTIMIDGRQNTQICIWDYLQLPLAIAFIYTYCSFNLLSFFKLTCKSFKMIVVWVLVCFSFNNAKWAQVHMDLFILIVIATIIILK